LVLDRDSSRHSRSYVGSIHRACRPRRTRAAYASLKAALANFVGDFEGIAQPLRTMSALPPKADIEIERVGI